MRIISFSLLKKLIQFGNRIVLPGFEGLSIYKVGRFFGRAMIDGALPSRASAMAFSFFLALFPAIIFIFSLIPFLPIENIDVLILDQLNSLLPTSAYELSKETIVDLANNQRGSLLSFGFFMMVIFSSNGINTMLEMFNQSVLTKEKRNFFQQWGIAISLMFILLFLLIISSVLIIFSQLIIDFITDKNWISGTITLWFLDIGRWIITLAFFHFSISFIYFLGPIGVTKWKFLSVGSTVSSLLVIIFSLGFAFYVNHFGTYNKFYGSIGTLMVIMLWIYFNSLVIIFGFELNASLARARAKNQTLKLVNE